MKRVWLVLSVVLPAISCVWPQALRQEAPDSPGPAPKIQVNVNRVLIPVVVRDRQGHSVKELRQEDFQLLQNGKPMAIANFSVETNEQTADHAANGQDAAAPATAETLPHRVVILLFDDMHLSQDDLAYVKKAGVKAVNGSLSATDMAAVLSTSGKTNSGLTRDRAKLEEAILGPQVRSIYRPDATECPKLNYYQADLIENKHDSSATGDAIRQVFSCNPGMDVQHDVDVAERQAQAAARRVLMVGDQDALSTYATTRAIIRVLAGLPGQHLLIFVSPGFLALSPEALNAESQMIDFAAQMNVIVSALDARGLYSAQLDATDKGPSMRDMNGSGGSVQLQSDYRLSSMSAAEGTLAALAEGTGGTFFHNSNDLDAGLALLTATPATVYLLEASIDDMKSGYHRLQVKVNRQGMQVQSRKGYFVAKPPKHKN